MRRVLAGVVVVLALASGLVGAAAAVDVAAPSPSSAEPTISSTPLTFLGARAMAVDPASGRVFVSGEDAIDVFAPDGTRMTTITGLPGAGGLDIAGGSLWATTFPKALVEIDLVSLEVVRSVPTPLVLEQELVVVGTQAFVRAEDPWMPGADVALAVDLVTGATRSFPGSYEVLLRRATGVTDRVFLVTVLFNEPSTVRTISTTPPYPVLAEWTTAGLDAVEVSSDGRVLWGVSDYGASTTAIRELDLATGQETAVGSYEGTPYIKALAHTPARGGLIAGSASTEVSFNQAGVARGAGRLPVSSGMDRESVEFSPDGLLLRRATPWVIERVSVMPSISEIDPGTAPAARGTRIQLRGSLLSGTSAITVGGAPATIVGSATLWIAFAVPTSVPPGTHEVVLGHPLGDMTTTLTVTDPIGDLSGAVRVGGSNRSGVEVRVSGGGLSEPLTTTTRAGDGAFTFSGLPAVAATYRLEVLQPSSAKSGQVVEHVSVVPNSTTNVTVDLRSASVAPAASTTTKLPGTSADAFGRFLTDPGSGTTFVQKGSELLGIDPDGDLIGRVRGFGAPQGITSGAGSVFVASTATSGPGSRITRVDAVTLAVTGEWAVETIDSRGIAYAGGKLFVLTDASGGDLQTFDPATGALHPVAGPGQGAGLATVGGAPNQLLVSTATGLDLLDVGAPSPTLVAELDGAGPDVATDGPTDRLWTESGTEYELSTMTPTGRVFGVQGIPTWSADHAGIVAFGPSIVSLATASVSHTLGSSPTTGLGSTGDAAFAPGSTGDLAVFDLTPRVTGKSAPPTFIDETFTLTGWGLRSTTAAEIDGVPVAFEVLSATQVRVHTAVTVGPHEVRLTTPWGATSPLAFVADARPAPSTVTSVDPATVPIAGGPVTIRGTDFTWATRIDVGGVAVTTFTVVDDTTIRFVAPPHPAGDAPIRVDNALVAGVPGVALSYVYAGTSPTVTSLTPNAGYTTGGSTVTIYGTALDTTVFVTFDGVPAKSVTVVSATQIRAVSPAHAAGATPVRVTNAGGMSLAVPAATFTYRVPPPSTTKLTPATGYTVGGTTVTLTGTAFNGATAVRFGGIPATSFTVVDDRTIVAVSPPRSTAGSASVLVTTPAGTDTASTSNRFSYTVRPIGAITGTVGDPTGPLGGMVVLVSPAENQSVVASAATGADGSFAVPELPVGSYRLNVFDGRLIFGLPARYAGGWYQAGGTITTSFAAATDVGVTAGGTAVIDPIVLDPTSPGSISGVVTDATGPVASMVVLVSPASRLEPVTYAVTGTDGRFTIGGLPPGEYKVVMVDGAVFFGLPPRYRTEWYVDVADSPTAFADAASVRVIPGGTTELLPIAVAPV